MKTILLPLHDDAGQDARVQVALSLSRALGGHLTCLGAAPDAGRVRDTLSDAGISWCWVEGGGPRDMADGIATAAGLADLIVASPHVPARRGASAGDGERDLAAALLRRTRTPILSVPAAAARFVAAGRVLVAWDGSDQVIAALRAATPLLRLATRVLLVEIIDGRVRAPAEQAALYLARHGVEAGVRRERRHDAPVAGMLRDMVRTGRFDQVVMGACTGRPAGGEPAGGVSQDMLRFSPVPLFLAA